MLQTSVRMTILTSSCFKSVLLSARPSLTPFSRKAPHSRKFLAPINQYHAPSWYPQLHPETLLVQVNPTINLLLNAVSGVRITKSDFILMAAPRMQ